ncbi:MAG TPA: hypothetical protein VNO54_24520, partial [Streptosporangiaceae bacterium]|nr:hypothetical protein [Streptosporangiaceae bacterium]
MSGWYWWADKLNAIHLVKADSWQQVSARWPASINIQGPFTSQHLAQVWHSDHPWWPDTRSVGPPGGGGTPGGGPPPPGGGSGTAEPKFDPSKFLNIIHGAIGDPYI